MEWFDIVNEKGSVIDKASRKVCHNGSKFLHQVVHIHIFNFKNQLLLQKRSIKKDIQPGKWDTSIGGHIMSEESLNNAIKREAFEELMIDIDINNLVPIFKYIFESDIEREFVHSFIYYYDGEIKFQTSEIDMIQFFSKEEIQQMIKNNMVTPNFIKEFYLLIENNKI